VFLTSQNGLPALGKSKVIHEIVSKHAAHDAAEVCESQVQLLVRFKQHDRARTYFARIAPLVFRHASH